jgi:hypothetical protein
MRKLHLAQGDIDTEFGIVSIDPAELVYAVLVDDRVGSKIPRSGKISGPFANPLVATFGLDE